MYLLEVVLLVAGVVTLVVGYRRNARNVMLAAALMLLCFGALGSFLQGVEDGYESSAARTL